MSTPFAKGERVTHVSARDARTNGTVMDIHLDAGREYFTVQLDDGREVQTIATRLRKGEYTGVGAWQRVLDAGTNCYFFFDEARNETVWDTPEAQAMIFGNGNDRRGDSDDGRTDEEEEDDGTVIPLQPVVQQPQGGLRPAFEERQQSFRSGLPAEDEQFDDPDTEIREIYLAPSRQQNSHPIGVVSRPEEFEDEEDDPEIVQGSFRAQPRIQQRVQAAQATQGSYQRTRQDDSGEASTYAPSSEAPIQPTADGYSRSLMIARSTELRRALIATGTESLAGNLQILGISTRQDEWDAHKLAGTLVSALSKLALTMSAQDLNLLLKHVMGGPENHALADRLSFVSAPAAAEATESSNPPIRNIILSRSPERSAPPSRGTYPPERLPQREPSPGYWANDSRQLSREGSGSMELRSAPPPRMVTTPVTSPPLAGRRPISIDQRFSATIDRGFSDERQSRGYQSFNETRSASRDPRYYDSYPASSTSIRSSVYASPDPQRSADHYAGREYSRVETVGSLLDNKRRDNLWSGVPPPSRAPPTGPSPPRQSPQRTAHEPSRVVDVERSVQRQLTPAMEAAASQQSRNVSPVRPMSSRGSLADYQGAAAVPLNDSFTADDYALPPIPSTSQNQSMPRRTMVESKSSPTEISIPLDDRRGPRPSDGIVRTGSPLRNESPRKLQSSQSSSVRFDDSMNEIHEHRAAYARSDESSRDVDAIEDGRGEHDEQPNGMANNQEPNGTSEREESPGDIAANLSDLNINLDKLLAEVASAGDRIDATWKPQHEELHVELPQQDQGDHKLLGDDYQSQPTGRVPPPRPPPYGREEQARYTPKPSKSCGVGCVVS